VRNQADLSEASTTDLCDQPTLLPFRPPLARGSATTRAAIIQFTRVIAAFAIATFAGTGLPWEEYAQFESS
jgi:hypothetical protein